MNLLHCVIYPTFVYENKVTDSNGYKQYTTGRPKIFKL